MPDTAASRANQPAVSNDGPSGQAPSSETRPCDGRMPYNPQKLAGRRTEPPVSLPSAKSTRPAAVAAAEPLEEPPVSRPGAFGFSTEP